MPPKIACSTSCCRRPGPRWVFGSEPPPEDNATRQKFRKKLREGELDDKEVDIEVAVPGMSAEILAPPGMEELTGQLQSMFQNIGGGKKKSRKLKISEAMKLLTDEEAAKLVNDEEMKPRPCGWSSRTASSSSTRSTRSPPAPTATAPMCRARACSATCCRWSRARPSAPSTAW
jgi:hypothetical protein